MLGNASKADAASAAYEAEFCHCKVSDDDACSHGAINEDDSALPK